MALGLRTRSALTEDPGSAPSTYRVAHNGLYPVPGDLTISSELCEHEACMQYAYIQAKI